MAHRCLFYPIYRTLGAAGLQFLKFALGLLTVWFIYLTARRRGADFWSSLLGLWFVQVFLGSGYSPVRAQLFSCQVAMGGRYETV